MTYDSDRAARKVYAQSQSKPIAYDQSRTMHDLAIVCAACARKTASKDLGNEIYEGEEWGGPIPHCERCGCEIEGLMEVES